LDSILERASRAIPRDDVDGEPSTTSARTFAVGLSGGVDSAIAAWALKRTGARVVGTLARNWDEANEDDGDERECAYVEDRKSARECAETLGLDDFVEVDFRREYWLDVFEPYVEAFESGATPNPDLECNRRVKFGALLRRATETMGATYLATGHYARIDRTRGGVRLMRGVDASKDQSYFLASVSAEALTRALAEKTPPPQKPLRAPLVAAVATRAPLDDDIDVILTPDGRATVARVAGVAHTASETTTRVVDKIPFDARRVRLTSRAPRVGAAARAPRVDGMIRIASLASDAVVARACVTNANASSDRRRARGAFVSIEF